MATVIWAVIVSDGLVRRDDVMLKVPPVLVVKPVDIFRRTCGKVVVYLCPILDLEYV